MDQHAGLPAGDLQPGDHLQHGGLRRLHRPGQGALHLTLPAVRSGVSDGPGTFAPITMLTPWVLHQMVLQVYFF